MRGELVGRALCCSHSHLSCRHEAMSPSILGNPYPFLPWPLPRCLPCPALLPHTLHDCLPLCLNATTPKPSLNPGLAGRPCSLLAGSILM